MAYRKEYRGQEVIATYDARLVPPNDKYPDCKCIILLTKQHLYVLEDNFDGTYETHFEFVVKEIDNIGIEQWEDEKPSVDRAASRSEQVVTGALCMLAGVIPVSGETRKRKIKREYFAISYHDIWGAKRKIYFHMNNEGAKKFIKIFHKLKEQ